MTQAQEVDLMWPRRKKSDLVVRPGGQYGMGGAGSQRRQEPRTPRAHQDPQVSSPHPGPRPHVASEEEERPDDLPGNEDSQEGRRRPLLTLRIPRNTQEYPPGIPGIP